MPKKTAKQYNEIKEYAIFIIADLKQKIFYAGNTPQKRLSSEYWEHYSGRRSATRELFEQGKTSGNDPKMFYLTTVETIKNKADSLMIPYIKFFLDKGFTSLNTDTLIEFTKNLEPENMELYQYIKNYEIEMLCNDQTDLFPDYSEKRKKKESHPDKITINLTEQDYTVLKKRAEKKNMTVTKYAKQIVLYEGKIVEVNFDSLNESIELLKEIETSLSQILYTIYRSGQYYPEDLSLLQEMVDQVKQQEKTILMEVKKEMKKMNQLLK